MNDSWDLRFLLGNQTVEPCKLYVVVRGDLRPGLRAAQAAHAVAEAAVQWPDHESRWRTNGNYLIVLEARDHLHIALQNLFAVSMGVTTAVWHEPDLDGELTAFAAFPDPGSNSLFWHLPLAYSRREWFRRYRA